MSNSMPEIAMENSLERSTVFPSTISMGGIRNNYENSRRSSWSEAAPTTSRKTSRIERISLSGGPALIEVDEELQSSDLNYFKVARKNSFDAPTTVGGVNVGSLEFQDIDKNLKKEIGHHSPEVVDPTVVESYSKSIDSKETIRYRGRRFRKSCQFIGHHLHLALATPAIVRIPHLAHKYATKNGSSFQLAYVMCLLLVAMPISVLEAIMAQYSSLGPINIFGRCLPILKGVGYGMVVTCSILMLISSVLLAWSTFYLFHSMSSVLPWLNCPANYTPGCYEANESWVNVPNDTYIPSDYYFQTTVVKSMQVSSEDTMQMNLVMMGILFGLWLLLLFCVSRHFIWVDGLLSHCAALLTFIMIVALMINGLSLSNSGNGLYEVFNLNFTKFGDEMRNVELWMDCLGQVFWSLGPTVGLLIARSSYHKFHHRIVSDVSKATVMNLVVQTMLVLAIFPYVGHLHGSIPQTVNIHKNLGFFFVISSYAVTEGFASHVSSVLLYFCVCRSLMSHTVMLADTVAVSLTDSLPVQWRSGLKRFSIDILVCIFGFVCSLPFVTKEGIYYITTTDELVPWACGVTLGFIEVSLLCYLYGSNEIKSQFFKMLKSRTVFIYICKYFISPVLLSMIVWVAVVGIKNPISWNHMKNDRESSYFTFGLVLTLIPMCCLAMTLLLQIAFNLKNLKPLVISSTDWGSAVSRHKQLKKTPERRDRRKPWLVVTAVNGEIIPSDTSSWIPYGYSWIPDRPTAQLMKEGNADISPFDRQILAHLLKDKFSCNASKKNISNNLGERLQVPHFNHSQKYNETTLLGQINANGTGAKLRPSRMWSIDTFLTPPNVENINFLQNNFIENEESKDT